MRGDEEDAISSTKHQSAVSALCLVVGDREIPRSQVVRPVIPSDPGLRAVRPLDSGELTRTAGLRFDARRRAHWRGPQ